MDPGTKKKDGEALESEELEEIEAGAVQHTKEGKVQEQEAQESGVSFDFGSIYQQFCYLGLFVSGMIFIVSLTQPLGWNDEQLFKDEDGYVYGIMAGAVTMFMAVFAFVLIHFESYEKRDAALAMNNLFLFIWNLIAAIKLTSEDGGLFFLTNSLEYPIVSGYFSAWSMAIFGTMAFVVNLHQIKGSALQGIGDDLALIVASIVYLCSISFFKKAEGFVSESWDGKIEEAGYSITIAGLSIIYTSIDLFFELTNKDKHTKTFTANKFFFDTFFAITWIILAHLLTTHGDVDDLTDTPLFQGIGTAFFSAYFGFFAALHGMLDLKKHLIPYAGLFFSAMILIIAVTNVPEASKEYLEENRYYEYSIAVGSVAMLFSLLAAVMDGPIKAATNYFLFFWAFLGACLLTFESTFEDDENSIDIEKDVGIFALWISHGYFASWLCALYALSLFKTNLQQISMAPKDCAERARMPWTLASLLQITSIALYKANDGDLRGFVRGDDASAFKQEEAYSLVISSATFVFMVVLVLLEWTENHKNIRNYLSIKFMATGLFATAWVILAILVSFRGPFLGLGNGFFSAYAGMFAGLYAFVSAWNDFRQEPDSAVAPTVENQDAPAPVSTDD